MTDGREHARRRRRPRARRATSSSGRRVLEQEAAGAGAQRLDDVLVEVEGGEDEDARWPGQPRRGSPRCRPCPACGCPSARRRARAARGRDRLRAVAGLADHLDRVRSASSTAAKPARISGWSSAMTTRRRLTTRRRSGSDAGTSKPRPSRGPAAERRRRASHARSRMPTRPWPPGRACRRDAAAVVGDRELERVRRGSRASTVACAAARVLDDVGERLLHDPVGGQLDARGRAAAARPRRRARRRRRPLRARSSSSGSSAEPGLGRERGRVVLVAAQQPERRGASRSIARRPRSAIPSVASRTRSWPAWRRAPAPGPRSARRCGRRRRGAPGRSAAAPRRPPARAGRLRSRGGCRRTGRRTRRPRQSRRGRGGLRS